MAKRSDPFGDTAPQMTASGYVIEPQRGQQAFRPNWTAPGRQPMSAKAIEAHSGQGFNIGLVCGPGGIVASDRDTDNPAVVAAIKHVFSAIYARGGTPVVKRGSKGATSILRYEGESWRNRSFLGRDRKPIYELLGQGRITTLPPSVHPKTGELYRWLTEATLLNTMPHQLPTITDDDIAALEEALQPFAPPRKQTAPPRAIIGKSSVDLSDAERRRYAAYANAILDRELRQLAAMAPASGRNKRAFDIACRIGRFAHHGIIPLQEIETGIFEACKANGLAKEDSGPRGVLMTIRNGIAAAAPDGLPDLGTQPRRGA